MSWSTGLILWIVLGGLAAWIFGEVARSMSKDREREWDRTADRKRHLARRAKQLSGESQ